MPSSSAAYEHAYAALEPRQRRPLDRLHLAKQSLGDAGIEQEILRSFNRMILASLDRLVTSTTLDGLRIELHVMRLAAGGVGAWPLAELAAEAEDAIVAGAPFSPERIDDIEMSVVELVEYVNGLIEPEPGE